MKKYSGEIGLILVSIIWGSGFVGTQLSLDGGLTPLQILTIRFSIASLILGILFFKQIKANINKEILKEGSILGIFLFLAFATQTIGLQYTTPSKNAFITAASVVIVPFIGFVLYKRKLDKIGIISSLVALIGIGILSLESDFSVNIGDALTLLSAVGFAFHIFKTSEFAVRHNAVVLSVVQFSVAFILSLGVQIFIGEVKIQAQAIGYLGVLYLSIFSTIIGFLSQTICQKKVDSTRTALILSTEAVFGTIFSIILLNEEITAKLIIGSILIFGSIITAETKLSFLKSKDKKYSEEYEDKDDDYHLEENPF
ncbi:MAG: DMT family transporter [Romboutsia sp.]